MTAGESNDDGGPKEPLIRQGLSETPASFPGKALIPVNDSVASPGETLSSSVASRQELRLLIVENDEADRTILRELLERAEFTSFSFDIAANVDAGLRHLSDGKHDVCIVNYELPGRDGLDLVRLAQRRGYVIPIILVSNDMDPEIDAEAAELGVSDFINKEEFETGRLERSLRFAVARRGITDRISRLSHYDDLTGLANRSLLTDRLERALASARRHNKMVGVLMVDLDGFKSINDQLGHSAGDHVLQNVAANFCNCLRECDTVGRYSGDEFIIIIEDLTTQEGAATVADKLQEALTQLIHYQDETFVMQASIGIALYPRDAEGPDTLLQLADAAMYRAKNEGGNRARFSTPELDRMVARATIAKSEIKTAFEKGEIQLCYRPQVTLASKSVGIGVAPVWVHQDKGKVQQSRLRRLVEEAGILEAFTDWMIEESCQNLREWLRSHYGRVHMSLPLMSRRAPFWKRAASRAADRLLRSTLEPQCIEFELDETYLKNEVEAGNRTISAIRELGLRLAVDNFGGGKAPPTIIRDMEMSTVRLAASLLPDTPGSNKGTQFLLSMVNLAKSLEMRVVALGVTSNAQFDIVRRASCDAAECLFNGAEFQTFEQCVASLDASNAGAMSRGEAPFKSNPYTAF